MDRDLEGKTAIITGGAKGIGFAIADTFLQNKVKVVILLDLDEKSGLLAVNDLETKYGQGKAAFIKCNVMTDLETVSEEIINKYKTIDVLVNNAGWQREDSIRETLALNLIALVEWTMKFLQHMRKDAGGPGGTIINISSGLGLVSLPYLPFYTASKHAVNGFSKTVGHSLNFKAHGVRVITLCPGVTRTNLSNFGELQGEYKEFMAGAVWQDPDAVGEAAAAIFRGADSGTVWVVDGGKPVRPVPSL
ncbi:15-hydroxyprostaglandin dehydrogenase [NAD(+)]-like [Ostrinia nubilalis]|uniref:15-hydroxyprostaglandin dehydrogenase [NAD(+)]-like n=1 Tax=Ostrinia furnacalis TaxID=93504 RepID=UPI00103FE492|nr:15-hydroxyprostaglandin dehydrogenase [NAD(+)]-like [Ostrinia furnacalis]